MASSRRTGWYRLKSSSQLFHGTIPNGATEVDPSAAYGAVVEKPVEAVQSSAPVGPEVAVVDFTANPPQVGGIPVGGSGPPGDEKLDGPVEGQESKTKRRRPAAPKDGDG